jgi:hypothetical protein
MRGRDAMQAGLPRRASPGKEVQRRHFELQRCPREQGPKERWRALEEQTVAPFSTLAEESEAKARGQREDRSYICARDDTDLGRGGACRRHLKGEWVSG